MRPKARALRLSLCFSILLPAVACRPGVGSVPPSAPGRLLKATMPDFDRPTLGGTRIDTASLRGKIVIVEFFAKYCEPCRRSLPEVERLHRRLGEDVVFVGVAEDPFASDAAAFARALGLSFAIVHDAGNVIAGRFRVTEIPATFLIDERGVVRWIAGPGMPEDALDRAIEALHEAN